MGTSTAKPLDQDKDVVFQTVELTQQDRVKAELTPNKPLSGFAYISDKRPAIYPQVEVTLAQQLQMKIREPEKDIRGELLPCYRLVAMPGCYYEGEWLKGRPSGYGKVYAKNGIYYEGSFEGGLATGKEGILVYPDGSFYRGSFKDNCFSGRGSFIYKKNGTRYFGDWLEDKPNGKGVETYNDKSRYEGEFKNGLKHGKGKYTFDDGKIFSGQFIQGQLADGKIIQKGSKGNYIGKFNNGVKIGNVLTTNHGTYTGILVNGLMHDPNGTFKWHDGKEYKGPFQFGQMHGQGKIKCKDGPEIVGKWVRGKNVSIISIEPK